MKKRIIYAGGTVIVIVVVMVCVLLALNMADNGGIRASATVNAADASTWVKLVPLVTLTGQIIHPSHFIQEAEGEITAIYRDFVDFNLPGRREVALTLTRGGEKAEITAILYILEPARVVEKEAGITPGGIHTADFFTNFNIMDLETDYVLRFVTDLNGIYLNDTGWYDVDLELNGNVFTSTLRIIDTTPPQAVLLDITVSQGQPISPDDFVLDIFDFSPVTVSFQEGYEPDVHIPGDHMVTLVLEDSHGNRTIGSSMLTVLVNRVPPVIHGTRDLEVMLGATIMYRRDVTAEDSFGNPIPFTVDSSEVDLNAPGEYTAVYRAVDGNGNQAEESVTVRVVDVERAMLEGMVQPIIDRIIKEGMTQREMAWEIYKWVSSNIDYVSDGPRNSVYEGALRALQNRSGDCYTFYAISEVLLAHVGIPTMMVSRIEGTPSRHFWNLVNADGGGWHHFDTTPTQVHGLDRFMFTDSQALEYTAIMFERARSREYYTYDRELYPEVMP
jgi:hypothetical protein